MYKPNYYEKKEESEQKRLITNKKYNVVEYRENMWKRAIPFINIMSLLTRILPINIAKKNLEKKRFKAGWYNMAWRYALLKRLGVRFIGNGYRIIQPNVCIYNPDRLSMGERITINDNSYIECSGGVEIGSDVMIGHGVSILSNSHKFDALDIPMNQQGETFDKIVIGSNVWIGAKATILQGVTINDGAVIGAHSLVNKDVIKNEVVGGTPIHHLRVREYDESIF